VRRAAAVGLIPSVRRGVALDLAYTVAERLHRDREDLIQKAVGWMLREVGKRDPEAEEQFLRKTYQRMPRTMLRYAIERLPEERRKQYLKGEI
jgi:3-methyladenine DNA glycosylase AlkD